MGEVFEDDEGTYVVVVNREDQHSLWPLFAAVPAGWKVVHGPALRQECLDYVDKTWTDMRPASLVRAMGDDVSAVLT